MSDYIIFWLSKILAELVFVFGVMAVFALFLGGVWLMFSPPKLFKRRKKPGVDYSLKKGDVVKSPRWTLSPLTVVDVNWALGAAAVQLGFGPTPSIVVWPVKGLVKVEGAS